MAGAAWLVAAQEARRPAGKVTEVFGNDADWQRAYGLLESQDVTCGQVGINVRCLALSIGVFPVRGPASLGAGAPLRAPEMPYGAVLLT